MRLIFQRVKKVLALTKINVVIIQFCQTGLMIKDNELYQKIIVSDFVLHFNFVQHVVSSDGGQDVTF